MSALRLLSACYYNIVSRVARMGKEIKREEKNKKTTRISIKKMSHIWGTWRRPVGRKEGCAPKLSCRLGQRQVSNGRGIHRKGTQGSLLAWRAASLLLGRLPLLY